MSKFFECVGHDGFMTSIPRKVYYKTFLQLIGRYLRASVMVRANFQATTEGTSQGGPASPFLVDIVSDDLDQELENRWLRFVRYADEFVMFAKSNRRTGLLLYIAAHRGTTVPCREGFSARCS